MPRALFILVLTSVAGVAGCFLELRGGYYPTLDVTATDTAGSRTSNDGGYVIGAYLGVRAELFGVAASVGLTGSTKPQGIEDGDGGEEMKGAMYRLDLELPLRGLLNNTLRPRFTLGYDKYNTYGEDDSKAQGTGHFIGLGTALPGGNFSLTLGPSWHDFVSDSSRRNVTSKGWGVEARIQIAGWIPMFLFKNGGDSVGQRSVTHYSTRDNTSYTCTTIGWAGWVCHD